MNDLLLRDVKRTTKDTLKIEAIKLQRGQEEHIKKLLDEYAEKVNSK